MKDSIPRYDKKVGEINIVYNKLRITDRKIIEKQVLRWNATAGKIKTTSKRNSIIKVADIIETGLDKITKDINLRLAALIRTSDLADSSKNDMRKYHKEFLRDYYPDWNKRFGNLKEFRLVKESIPKKYETLPSIIDYGKMINKSDSIMIKTFIQLALETAGRGNELLNCRWGDFNEQERNIKLISTKNKTVRIIPLEKTLAHLKRWKKEFIFEYPTKNDFIFPNMNDRNKHVTLDWINGKLEKLSKETLGRSISVYCIRHSVLTFLQTKLPTKIYEKVADHSIETASRYSHLNYDDVKIAMNELVYEPQGLDSNERNKFEKKIDIMQKIIILQSSSMPQKKLEKELDLNIAQLMELDKLGN